MGQAQSEESPSSVPSSSSQPAAPTLAFLVSEAAEYGNGEDESLDAKAKKALECPCIADLRDGPCGVQFSDAFLCFLKSTAEEKGADCVSQFVAMQKCLKANPDAYSKVEEVTKEEEPAVEEYRIIPPSWSRDSPKPPKPKL